MKDEKLHKVYQATMIIGITFMSSLLIALTIALWRLCKRARFKFLFTIIILLMLSDAAFAILSVCFYYEHTDVHKNYTKALAWTVGISTFFFNFGTLTMFWLFALKYWIISREVPKLFAAGRLIRFSEQKYKIIKYIGFLVNLIPCLLIAFFRGRLTAESG